MKALLAQLACRIGDVTGNTSRAVDAIRSHPEVDIAVFPELYLSGYTYRKTHLFASEAEAGFVEGEEQLIVELAGRCVAPLICFDVEFPEPARLVALAGADLLVTASANMDPFWIDHAVSSVARAHENRLPHLYANLVGNGDGLMFVGASRSIAPTGETLVEASRDREELLVVPVAELGGFDERTDYPKLVRPTRPVTVLEKERSAA